MILRREAELGAVIDPVTGYPVKHDVRDAPVEYLPDMAFWLALDRELIGSRNENGFVQTDAIYAALDRWGIRDEDNRSTAKLMLDSIAAGRNEAANEKHDRESDVQRDSEQLRARPDGLNRGRRG